MHRGTSYLSMSSSDGNTSDNSSSHPSRIRSSSSKTYPSTQVLQGIGCLILGSTLLFLLSPSPNTHPGGVGGGLLRQIPDESSNSVNPVYSSSFSASHDPRHRTRKLPVRIQSLLAQSQIVGDHLNEVKEGKKTVEEVIHSGQAAIIARNRKAANANSSNNSNNDPDADPSDPSNAHANIGSSVHISPGSLTRSHKTAPLTLQEITDFLTSFLQKLNSSNLKNKRATYHGIWSAYHLLVNKWLYPWDQEYLRRIPVGKSDESLFLSVVSYRDEFCSETLKEAYGKARFPERLFVGLVQQDCQEEKCKSGVLEGNKVEEVGPDPDCYKMFCESAEGKEVCDKGQVRLLRMKETESLGPYMARYFASKLWMGEQWYMQIDSHMTFLQDWDEFSIDMLKKAPSDKPVISHYPPPHTANLLEKKNNKVAAPRLCGPSFATSDLESEIIRLDGSYNYDSVQLDTPRFAPFVAAGYLISHSDILRDVPFDPFLPYIFMGEEILLSARLWTSGYDMFSPTFSVVGHHYVRNHQPKFWESIHRAFTFGVHNPLQMLVLNRVKYQLGYPESAKDMVKPKSLFTAVEQYSMGTARSLDEYLKIVGLDMYTKEVTYTAWCETGIPPPGFEHYLHLYRNL